MMLDAASYNLCISLSGMDSAVLLIWVSSASFDMVLIKLVRYLSEFASQDTKYMHDMEKFREVAKYTLGLLAFVSLKIVDSVFRVEGNVPS